MTIRTDAAPAVIQSVLTDAERHQLLARANYPHLQEEPGSNLVKITEDMVRTKLLAALPTGEARAVPPHQWQTTVAQMKVLAAELSLAAETMGGDDEESRDIELVLAVAPAATVQDDDGAWNEQPILTVRLEEYPEEGVYPVDPRDPTGGRIDAPTPPATTQDEPITVSLDPDPRGVSVGVWQGSHCIYKGAHAVPVAQDDAKDELATFSLPPTCILHPVATAFFTEKGEVAYTGIYDRTLKALEAVKTTRMGISAGSIDLYIKAPAPAAGDALPTIKGAAITGGYVVVTPAGWGEDKPQKVRDAILRLFPVNPAYTPNPEAAQQGKGDAA
ncbi:hypothetical protein IPU70_01925 [Achromobacter sp. SD115]|uniref:hypothetical protein n=1 Tax=Achromobacter sp. SD115 TaxID=2782011 RepID=UPI001A97727E|nr:hypothetical protein [Achromobacter sp. SD115]MBO1012291.1 hypothetical protein [Achromobacter sp. SD115]